MSDQPECKAFSEVTIKEPGWYFFYPKNPSKYERPRFAEVDQDSIEGGWLRCPKYAGTYMGPITPPPLPKTKFEVGKTYETQDGDAVTVIAISAGDGYECMECSDGGFRYDHNFKQS